MPGTKPVIIINFKTYSESYGYRAHDISEAAETVADESGLEIVICPGFMDIHPMSNHHNLPVFAQHIDGISPGAYTGHILAEAVRAAGAKGTLINHSERRLTLAEISAAVDAAKRTGLKTVICTNDTPTSVAAASLFPDYVAIEPPELIGSGISVTTADPEIIRSTVDAVKSVNNDVKVLAGAGISSGSCVKTALELGSDGVLLASGVVKADDPLTVLRDLISQI